MLKLFFVMKKILAAVNGDYRSITSRVLAVARELKKQNYEIVFSGVGTYMSLVDFPVIKTDHIRADDLEKQMNISDALCIYTEKNLDYLLAQEQEAIMRVKPDLILRDILREPLALVAKQNNIPDVMFQKATTSPFYTQELKSNHPFIELARPHVKDVTKKIRKKLVNIFYYHLDIKAREMGILDDSGSCSCLEDLTLITDHPDIFHLDIPKSQAHQYLGPILEPIKTNNSCWFDDFIRDNRKKILISGGSTGYHEKDHFFNHIPLDKYAVVFKTVNGFSANSSYFGNFEIRSLLPYCDVFINHGGTGSTYFGLLSGVPMLMSYDHFEQQANAVQAANKGVALLMPHQILNKENVSLALDYLDDSSFKENSLEVKKMLGDLDSVNKAVEAIKNVLQ